MAYSEWPHVSQYRIQNHPGSEGYVCTFTIPWRSGMTKDFRDIRFSDLNGKKLSYWIESYTDFTTATVYVRLGTSSTVYLHYGNPSVQSESTGSKTFDYFDDFSENTLSNYGYYSESSSYPTGVYLAADSKYLAQTNTGPAAHFIYCTVDNVPSSYTYEVDVYVANDVQGRNHAGVLFEYSSTTPYHFYRSASLDTTFRCSRWDSYSSETTMATSISNTSVYADGRWLRYKVSRNRTTGATTCKTFYTNTLYATQTFTNTTYTTGHIGLFSWGCETWYRNLKVYKYAAAELTAVFVSSNVQSLSLTKLLVAVENKNYLSIAAHENTVPYLNWPTKIEYKIKDYPGPDYVCTFPVAWKAGMAKDFRDLRFSDSKGSKLSYWVESYTEFSTATVHVRLGTSSTVYLHYGNAGAVSESNGNKTFDFFDHFDNTTFDSNKWTIDTGSPTISSSSALCGGSGSYGRIKGKTSFGSGYSIRARARVMTVASLATIQFGDWNYNSIDVRTDGQSSKFALLTGKTNNSYQTTTLTAIATDTNWHIHEVQWCSSSLAKLYIDGAYTVQSSSNLPTGPLPVIVCGDQTSGIYCDWIYVKKYATTEPTAVLVSSNSQSSARLYPIINNKSYLSVAAHENTAPYLNWSTKVEYRIKDYSGSGYICTFPVTWKAGMAKDFKDIRFSDSTGTRLSYYIESYTEFTSATVQVRLGTSSNVFLHYGNPSATSESNGDKTFELFDDFSSATLDASKWTVCRTAVIENGACKIGSASTQFNNIKTVNSYGEGYAVVVKAKPETGTTYSHNGVGFGYVDASGGWVDNVHGPIGWYRCWDSPYYAYMYKSVTPSDRVSTSDYGGTYHVFEVARRGLGYSSLKIDGTTLVANQSSTYTGSLPFIIRCYDGGKYVYVDYCYVKKCAAIDPTPVLVSSNVQPLPATKLSALTDKKSFPLVTAHENISLYLNWSTKIQYRIKDYPGAGYSLVMTVPWRAGMSKDFKDIRFSDSTNTALSYWIESYTECVSAKVYIKLGNSSTVYLHYGNPFAKSESDGNKVFSFFDDFSGAALDSTKWTWTQTGYFVAEKDLSYATINTGYNTPDIYNGCLRFSGTRSSTDSAYESGVISGWWGRSIRSVNGIADTSFIVETKEWFTQSLSVTEYNSCWLNIEQDINNFVRTRSVNEVDNTWRYHKLVYIAGGNCTRYTDSYASTAEATPNLTTRHLVLAFAHRWASATITGYFDWVLVRPYVATEPTAVLVSSNVPIPTTFRLFESSSYTSSINYYLPVSTVRISADAYSIPAYNSSIVAHENIDFLSGWSYVSRYKVNNYPGSGYVVSFTLNWRSGMAKDFKDIRIYDSTSTKLPYWIENYTASTSAKVHVKLGSSDILNIYFGNPSAKSESNGSNVFIFFDDFRNGTSKWASFGMSIVADGNDMVAYQNATYTQPIKSSVLAIENWVLECDFKWTSISSHYGPRFWASLGNIITLIEVFTNGDVSDVGGSLHGNWLGASNSTTTLDVNTTIQSVSTNQNWTTDIWYTAHLTATSYAQKAVYDGKLTLAGNYTRTTPCNGYIDIHCWDTNIGTYIKIRNPRVRKYAAVEPTLTLLSTTKIPDSFLRNSVASLFSGLPSILFLSSNDLLLISDRSFTSDILLSKPYIEQSDLDIIGTSTSINDLKLEDTIANSNDILVFISRSNLNEILLVTSFASKNKLLCYFLRSFLNYNDVYLRKLYRSYLDIQVSKTYTNSGNLRLIKLLDSVSRIEVGQFYQYSSDILSDLVVVNLNELLAFLDTKFESSSDLNLEIDREDLIDIILEKSFSSSHGLALDISHLVENFNDILLLKDSLISNNDIIAFLANSVRCWNDIFLQDSFESSSDLRVELPFSSTNDLKVVLQNLIYDCENDIYIQTPFEDVSDVQTSLLAEDMSDIKALLEAFFENSNDMSLFTPYESSSDIEAFLREVFESTNDILLSKPADSINDVWLATGKSASTDIQMTVLFASMDDLNVDRATTNLNDLLLRKEFVSDNDSQVIRDLGSVNDLRNSKVVSPAHDIFTEAGFQHITDIDVTDSLRSDSDLKLAKNFTSRSTIYGLLSQIYETVNDICLEKEFEYSHDIIMIFSDNLVAAVSLRDKTVVVFYKRDSVVSGRNRTVEVD